MTGSYDPRAEILWSGTDDWVSLAEAATIVADERDVRTARVRAETLDILGELLRSELIIAGEVLGGFEPWGLEHDDALERIKSRWSDPASPPSPFDGTWFANTAAGEAEAKALADAGFTTRPEPGS